MADLKKIKLPDNTVLDIKDSRITGVDSSPTASSTNVVTSGGVATAIGNIEHFYFVQGTSSHAGSSTSGAYLSTKWEGAITGITTPTNGLKIAYRIATNPGVSSGGVVLSINGTTGPYYPVVIQKNTMVTTHYPVGATFLAVFNSTQTATAYLTAGSKSTVTGCWQIMEYDSNTNTYQREYVSSDNTEYAITARYNTSTGESYYAEYGRYSEGVTLNPSTNAITASKFKVSGGTSSQFLKADGSVDSNTYATTAKLTDGSVTKVGTSTVGSTTTPIYLNAGTPTAVTNVATTLLLEPSVASSTLTSMSYVDSMSGNKFMFIPPEHVIIEQTTDGGTTWTDAGVSDAVKKNLFAGNYASGVGIPLKDNMRNTDCGIRITITAMNYSVPSGTTETNKYQYWNSSYASSNERYVAISNLYFWMSSPGGIYSSLYAAKGSDSNNWDTIYENRLITGWSGGDLVGLASASKAYYTFGGSTSQTSNYWNYRFVFFGKARSDDSTYYPTNQHYIYGINGYGSSAWTAPNGFVKNGHLYSWDSSQNANFPASIFPKTNNVGALGASSLRWGKIYAKDADFSGTATISGNATVQGAINAYGSSSSAADTTTGINIMRDSTQYGHIGTSTTVLGIFAPGKIVLRPSGATSSSPVGSLELSSSGASLSGNMAVTGTLTAPTATAGTNTTQVATTAFVQTAISNNIFLGDVVENNVTIA